MDDEPGSPGSSKQREPLAYLGEIILFIGLVGIITAITVIIFLTRKGWKLGWVMLSGSLIVAIFSGMYPLKIIEITGAALISSTTIDLALIVIAITSFGYILKEIGALDSMLVNLSKLIKDLRLLVTLIPALVGLLMVPGGAVLSAPMIEGMGDELNMDGNSISAVNVLFRHLLFLIFPFYPGILLISELSGVDVYFFIRFNLLILILGLATSFLYFFYKVPNTGRSDVRKRLNTGLLKDLFLSLSPFILVLVLGIGGKLYFPLALFAGIMYSVIIGNPGQDENFSIKERALLIWPGINWHMTLAIVGIMIFKDFIQFSGALDELSLLLLNLGIPLLLLAILFPLIAGLLTGNHSAALGMSVPLFLPLLPHGSMGSSYLAIMNICSLVGYLVSPFHLCLILTVEHFKASLPRVILKLAVIGTFLIAIALIQLLFY